QRRATLGASPSWWHLAALPTMKRFDKAARSHCRGPFGDAGDSGGFLPRFDRAPSVGPCVVFSVRRSHSMHHPFADLVGLSVEALRAGYSQCQREVKAHLLCTPQVVHGAVMFSLADTGMGVALYPTLEEGELCATIEVKINYFKPVAAGLLTCITELVSRGRTVANLESKVYAGETLVA